MLTSLPAVHKIRLNTMKIESKYLPYLLRKCSHFSKTKNNLLQKVILNEYYYYRF